jgi:putative endonuclease
MYAPDSDSIISWRGVEVPRFPHYRGVVYLLHFSQPLGNPNTPHGSARHYLGSTCDLEARLHQHRYEVAGAKIMQACRERGISFEVVRLWRVASWEEQRDLEIRLKRRHEHNYLCPLCRHMPGDPLAMLYQGHWPFHVYTQKGKLPFAIS